MGESGKNFVQRLINKLQNAERVLVPVDQVGSPTYAPNLADAVVELAELDAQGLYHVVGPKLASRYDFAVAVAHTFDLDAHLLESIPTSQLVQVAPRPLKAGMTIEKAQAVLKTTLVDYEEGLRLMVTDQLESKQVGF